MTPPLRPHCCPGPQPFLPRSRREFLKAAGCGFGLLGLTDLLTRDLRAVAVDEGSASGPLTSKTGHFPAKAKHCIFLFMTGGPSQMDLFDPKPLLNRLDSQPLPPSFGKIHSQFLEDDPLCLGSHRKWGRYGQSGIDMSDLVPHLHRHADDIATFAVVPCRQRDPCARNVSDEYRPRHDGLSQPGKLGHLRTGIRERELARIRGNDPTRRDARRRRAMFGRGVSAGPSSGNVVSKRAGADRQSRAATGRVTRPAAPHA